jgi:putative lipoprotein
MAAPVSATALCLASAVAAVAFLGSASAAEIAGQASYRERIATPPGAVFEAVLEDLSPKEAPPEEVGRTAIDNAGNPPWSFTLAYDEAAIQPDHSYAVRASLKLGSKRLFATADPVPVITAGNPTAVDLLLVSSAAAADAPLQETYWKLSELSGAPIDKGLKKPPFIVLHADGRASGFTGCNRMGGPYQLDGQALSFGPFVATFMYCEGAADTERALLDILPKVKGFAIDGGRLELRGESGDVLARFEAAGY